jgi:Galactose oxidase, central domain
MSSRSCLVYVGRLACCLSLLLLSTVQSDAASWTKLTNLAPSSIQLMVQMTDGTILVQSFNGQTWMKLTPDAAGSYINGTWTTLAPGLLPRIYFASQVLPNGKFWLLGGEYTGPGLAANWGSTGEIYDPVANSWSPIAPFPSQAGCPQISYVTGNLTFGSPVITNIYPYTSGLAVGWIVTGTGIPTGSTILSINSPTQITISANATATRIASTVNFNHSYTLTACFGDDPSMLVPGGASGRILAGDLINGKSYLYDIATDSWIQSGTKVFATDSSGEEGWVKQADGTILTYDLFRSIQTSGSYAEKYNPATGTWSSISPSDGSALGTIPQLSSAALGFELGPLLRLQDGRILVIGANQHTALYTPGTNTWAAGPDITGTLNGIPSPFGGDDSPASILPSGHVIFAADAGPSQFTSSGNITNGSNVITNILSTAILQVGWSVSGTGIPSGSTVSSVDSTSQIHINRNATATAAGVAITFGGTFSRPTQLFDFNPISNTISPVSPAIPDTNLNTAPVFPMRMLVLPTGQMLFSDSGSQVWAYTPDGAPNPALRPVINNITYGSGGVFTLTGKQLNGQSAGAAYGDDDQMDTNYPIVSMVSGSGNVFYARTTNWTNFGVGTGTAPQTVNFTLNPNLATPGNHAVIVSGAGISSFPVFVNITQAEINKQ